MAKIDNETSFDWELTQTPTEFNTSEFNLSADTSIMDDHDMLLEHVAQSDHELYGLDCCLSDMFGV